MVDRMMPVMLAIGGVTEEDMMHTRKYPCPVLRGMMYIELQNAGLSLSQIGRCFYRDHASVLQCIRRTMELLDVDKEIRGYYEYFKTTL